MIHHLAFVVIIIILPLVGYYEVKKLKSSISDSTKQKSYQRIFAVYIITLSIVLSVKPINKLLFEPTSLEVPAFINYLLWSIVTYQVFMLLIPSILIIRSKRVRAAFAEEYEQKEYMLPRSRRSMIMFSVLALIVGIAEEVIFRGFFYSYFQHNWGFNALWSFTLINVLFGLGHYQQGKSGVIDTMLLGFALSYLYINTGSLILPIAFHILYDLKIVYFSWVVNRRPEIHKEPHPVE